MQDFVHQQEIISEGKRLLLPGTKVARYWMRLRCEVPQFDVPLVKPLVGENCMAVQPDHHTIPKRVRSRWI